jgi:predicted transcriptional regulator
MQMQFKLDDALIERLESIAVQQGCDVKECATQAVMEYLDIWEDHMRSMDLINHDERVALSVM